MDEQPTADASMPNGPDKEQSKKISAYYSLVFPEFTFYIQTLSVTIGRRCSPAATSTPSSSLNTADNCQVDVDLGTVKSVSRLHAKIEYDRDEDRFVLVVIGRNGAWVDGVWLSSGSRAILRERSQIQIASRIFHFVLPPPPPEDPPSPSSQSSGNRPRSPSLDITSISPPSSLPSHSPPPRHVKRPSSPPRQQRPPTPTEKPQKPPVNSKKRKKGDTSAATVPPKERPKPEEMPPKPAFTYAQLIYRAIKALDGKATLQEIINWIMNEFDYYRFVDGTAWTSSVRHNLSSSRAFKKMERCGGDRGKGFFWSLDEEHLHQLEEQEAKNQASDAKRRKDKGGASLSDPPLKRSIKGDTKGVPLPPPLTSTPLPPKTIPTTTTFTNPAATGIFAYNSLSLPPGYPLSAANPYTLLTQGPWAAAAAAAAAVHTRAATTVTPSTPAPSTVTQATPAAETSSPAIPDVIVPIVLGPIPPSHSEYSPNSPNNSAREGYMILHEGKIIIDPDIFSGYTKEMLDDLAKLGANQALKSLTAHAVKALREKRIKARKDAKGKSRTKNTSQSGNSTVTVAGTSSDVVTTDVKPLLLPDPESTIVVVDDSEDDGPVTKKRKTESMAQAIAVS